MISAINKFKKVDDFLYRGARPNEMQIIELKNAGIKTIIDFTIRGGKAEADIAKKYSLNYINIPLIPFQKIPNKYVTKFFEQANQARTNDEKVFIHCWRGKDRTGLFAAMYKIKYGLGDLKSCIDEMIQMGHNRWLMPHLLSYLKKFNKNINT